MLSAVGAAAGAVLWARHLALVFGAAPLPTVTVLGASLAGLAVGGLVAARRAERAARPLRAWGRLQLALGVLVGALPPLVAALVPAYGWLAWALDARSVALAAVQVALIGLPLLLATALAGGAPPLLARVATGRRATAGAAAGRLVALLAAGALLGLLLCTLVLLPLLGLRLTTLAFAGLQLLLGLGGLALDRRGGPIGAPAPDVEAEPPPAVPALALATAGIGGAAALAHEVAWTRLLALVLGESPYVFAWSQAALLLGLALGAAAGGRLADRALAREGAARVIATLGVAHGALAVLCFALLYAWPELPFAYVGLVDAFGAAERPRALWAVAFLLGALVAAGPAALAGLAFPLGLRALVGRADPVGARFGLLAGVTTLGAATGAVGASAGLVPLAGLQWTAFLAIVAELVAAGVLLVWAERRLGWRWAGAPLIALATLSLGFLSDEGPPWDPLLATSGMYREAARFADHSREGIRSYAAEGYELLFYEEGASSVVTVARASHTTDLWLAEDGRIEASTTTDLPVALLVALLPLQFVEMPDSALVVGLGSGIGAGALSRVGSLERIAVVEREPAMTRAALYFGARNHDVLLDERVEVVVADARDHVVRTPRRSWDVVAADAPSPWVPASARLYTREFLAFARTRLDLGGVWAQRLPLDDIGPDALRSLARTFAEAFPHALAYTTPAETDLVLLGSDAPLVASPEAAERLLRLRGPADDLATIGVRAPFDLLTFYVTDRAGLLALAGDAPLHTDDRPVVEHTGAYALARDPSADNAALLRAHATPPALPGDAEAWADLARAFQARRDSERAIATMMDAVDRLPPTNPLRKAWLAEAKRWQDAQR